MDAKIQNCAHLFDRGESLVQLCKAQKAFPFDVSPPTLRRWFVKGISTPDGHYRLETAVCGNKRFTSREAIARFLRVQQGQHAEGKQSVLPPKSRSMTEGERKREMKRLGLRPQSERSQQDQSELHAPVQKTPGKVAAAQTSLTRKEVAHDET